MLSSPLAPFHRYKAGRHLQRSRYQTQLADVPAELFPYWAGSAASEFEGIPRDVFFFTRAAEALMQFFDCAADSTRACALPSKAADSVWHAWLRFAPMGLEQFCVGHFGKVIPHVEAAHLQGPLQLALAVCLVKARAKEGLERGGPDVPCVFALDHQLRMPSGHAYMVKDGRVAYALMNRAGRVVGAPSYPSAFFPALLEQHGLIESWEAEQARRRAGKKDSSDSSDDGAGCGNCGHTATGDDGSGGGDD